MADRVAPSEFEVPACLAVAAREEGREQWLDSLPGTVARFCVEWGVTAGPPFQPGGHTAWVAPARTVAGAELVLKVAWRHPEADQEADGLQVWAGNGAVTLHRHADLPDTIVLLLERAVPGAPLSDQPQSLQDEVIIGLLPRLWVDPPAGHRFRPLTEMCGHWADEFDAGLAAGRVHLDPGLAAEGISLFRSLPGSADRQVLLCTDLHAGNVLAAAREPWLIIDPKPYVGDPAYDVLQHLLNSADRLRDAPSEVVVEFADRLGVDRDRLRWWLFARCVQESADWPGLADIARQLGRGD